MIDPEMGILNSCPGVNQSGGIVEEDIKFEWVGDLRDYDYGGEVWVSVFRCAECLSLVDSLSQEGHEAWHRRWFQEFKSPGIGLTVRESE